MKKKILLCFLTFALTFFAVACNVKTDETSQTEKGSAQQLQIFKTDLKLSQDQVLSQMKAERLKENNGYLDSDEIVVMVTLKDDALIDVYNSQFADSVESLGLFATSESGQSRANRLSQKQDALIEELQFKGLIDSVENRYTTILNAIAVKTTYGKIKNIEKLSQVETVILSETYNRPQSTDAEGSAVENVVDVYETGIFNSSTVSDLGITGNGTAVAVLDSGFDCSHTVFANQPTKQLIGTQEVSSVLSQTNASGLTKGLELFDVYYSKKIPFMYDYADKDADVFPYDSEHGTHVAGIIGGQDTKITGVAVDTQLVLMKVFPDLSDGGRTEDILAALEDAILLGVDAINMSLGSSCGFAREIDEQHVNEVYDKLNESGISVITAASNSYSSAFGGAQGNTNMVTNPDSGTVGSPSTYAACLSVASISGVKSRYIIGNDSQVFFFKESNSITGDENDFVGELAEAGHIKPGETKTFEYVTVPGSGLKVNYSTLGDLSGKIALVRRGDNTFEEKAQLAKAAGAIACIIYNNVDGDISMSMGKTDHIPTVSISKDDGTILAQKDKGKLTISFDYQAGPFMSDFSSWGPTPSLGIKPEITAHGGTITSSIPGGGYDELSGTSMATPNLCGIVVLIRQYLKEKYPSYTSKQISVLTNQLLMSTANIVLNEEGNPYSPRKQGAGLASIYNVVHSNAYLTVDGIDRPKLELLDDPQRTGVYEMEFNVVNTSDKELTYDLSVIAMTESVSTSDEDHVSEKSKLLDGAKQVSVVSGGTLNGDTLTVKAGEEAKVKVVYTLSNKDKEYIDASFPYGMYVEGFVELKATGEEIDLNIPFLAFYGDWTEAPMFDKTYYEVESEAHNNAIDDEDKLKADYYATTPYGSYYYNYIIPLGTYLYDVDLNKYDAIPASEDKIAMSNILGTIDGLSVVYGGLLRNAKVMRFTIVDKNTGEVVWSHTDYNANKAYSVGGEPIPYYELLDASMYQLGLVNNREYEFKMEGELDYGDGGVNTNIRNSFGFDFTMDDEAPVLKDVTYEKEYDKLLKKDRYYINMTIYDNHYAQSITPLIFTSDSSYAILSENPIPIYSEKGEDTVVRFEITDYLEDIYADEIITSALAFSIDDYALNSNIYLCQLPGTDGEFKFTKDGTPEGTDMLILSMTEGEVVDVTQYLSTTDKNLDENKDYLKYLTWASSNEKIVKVKDGLVYGVAPGRTSITVAETLDGRQAMLMINVKAKEEATTPKKAKKVVDDAEEAKIESIRFSYFETIFAYSRAAQTSEIGETGDRLFLQGMNGISFYPGEKIKLYHDFDPWYAEPNYTLSYKSLDPNIAMVEEDGTVTALKEGTTYIVLNVEGSNLMAKVKVTVKNPFVIENRTLIAYKGLGGDVVIPDDEGIIYISAYAFCLYDTDNSIKVDEEDYDANKIPAMNTSITSVVIPDGVEEIQKYAFYNCTGLESVTIPSSVRFIREYAFYNDSLLEDVDLSNVEVIGRSAFYNCTNIKNVNLDKAYSIGIRAFEGCTGLESVDLTSLRNSGREIFKDCTNLNDVVLTENTKLSYAMFVNTGLVNVDIYEKVTIPEFCFAKCANLETVTIHNDIVQIGYGAFSELPSLESIEFKGVVEQIGEQAFYGCDKLTSITLPNNEVSLGNYSFYECTALETVKFGKNTKLTAINGSIFEKTAVAEFVVDDENTYYNVSEDGMLVSEDGKTIVFACPAKDYANLTISSNYDVVGASAFTGTNVTILTIENPNLVIEDYAFANCANLLKIVFPVESNVKVGNHTFQYAEALTTILNLDQVKVVGDYGFANTGLTDVTVGSDATYGEGAFFKTKLVTITIGANTKFGLGAFQNCANLTTVNMPEAGNVHFGVACFANDAMLSTIDLSKLDSIIEDETFYGCSSLKTADLLNVKVIGDYAFSDCRILSYVNVPVVEKIGVGAFARYDELVGGAPTISSITLPNTLKEIGEGAFIGCEGLLEIEIPSSVNKIDNYMFAYCLNLGKVVLPENIKSIGLYSFAGCSVLTDINLENVETFDEYAFTSCALLENINLANAKEIGYGAFASTLVSGVITANELNTIGDLAFQGAKITKVVAPKLAHIGEGAFDGCTQLKDVCLSSELSYVGAGAFDRCSSLEELYYLNDGEKATTGIINDYARLDNGILYVTLPNGHLQLSTIPGGMKAEKIVILEDTYRIDAFAGSRNSNVKYIVFPDTLKIIGNYAFYKCNNLKIVEFRSVTAPALEDSYDSSAVLEETDPGFEKLHQHFDLFGYELYYYNFIDLVGKKDPITMILPANTDLKGYDSIVYEVYFGTVSEAERSTYVAMEQNLINFIEYAQKVMEIEVVTLGHETLINNAVRSLNSVKQNALDYGYTQEEWDLMVAKVNKAKSDLSALKLSYADKNVQQLQEVINNLPSVFEITMLEELNEISKKLSSLTVEDKKLLDLTKYNNLVASYNEYRTALNAETEVIYNAFNNSFVYISALIASVSVLSLAVILLKKKFF